MTVEATIDENSLMPSQDVIKAKLDRAAKLDAEILDLTRAAYDPADKLTREVKLGRKFIERAKFQRDNVKPWNKRAYSDLASKQEEQAKIILGVSDVRMDVSAKVAAFVDWMKPGSDLIDKVPYNRIANFLLPMFEWDCVKLEGQVNPDWLDFLRSIVADNAKGKDLPDPMSIAMLREKIETKQKQIDSVKPEAKPDPDKAGKEATRKAKLAETQARKVRDAARDGIADAAREYETNGQHGATDKAKTLEACGVECGIDLWSVETINPASAVEFIEALFKAGKVAELNAIVNAATPMLAKMVEMMKARQAA